MSTETIPNCINKECQECGKTFEARRVIFRPAPCAMPFKYTGPHYQKKCMDCYTNKIMSWIDVKEIHIVRSEESGTVLDERRMFNKHDAEKFIKEYVERYY